MSTSPLTLTPSTPSTSTPAYTGTGGKRKVNNALKAWVKFVKKVQKEEKIIKYGDAIHRAAIRKEKGEKWMTGGGLDTDEEALNNSEKIANKVANSLFTDEEALENNKKIANKVANSLFTDEEDLENSEIIASNAAENVLRGEGGRRRRRTMRRSKSRGRSRASRRSKGRSRGRGRSRASRRS